MSLIILFRFKKALIFVAVFIMFFFNSLYSQDKSVNEITAKDPASEYSEAIEDNSFLIEEAYNQEPGVVQHIFTGMQNFTPIKNWDFSFTQEWPMWGQTSQFSYTVLYSSYNSGGIAGFGDILLNYRYQLFEKEDFAAIAPRLSLIVPVGDKDKGLGNGTPGIQFNFPVSKRISNDFAAHFNAGFTLFPGFKSKNTKNEDNLNSLTYYNAGASIIWLPAYNLNFMLEVVTGNNNSVDENGSITYFNESIINPGFRYAIDIGDLQIIPGLAFPITFSEGETSTGIYLYLSFEHPF
jgi:hypothetical protein